MRADRTGACDVPAREGGAPAPSQCSALSVPSHASGSVSLADSRWGRGCNGRRRDRPVGMGIGWGSGGLASVSSGSSFGWDLGGQDETGVLRVMRDPVASAAGRFSSRRPRRPAEATASRLSVSRSASRRAGARYGTDAFRAIGRLSVTGARALGSWPDHIAAYIKHWNTELTPFV
jgi:hypothetical protein